MKSKIFLFIILLGTASAKLAAQQNERAFETDSRTSKPYHSIHISGEMNVKIVHDETPGVTVKGSGYQIENTVSMLRNDTLFVFQTNTRKGEGKTFVKINVDNI